MKTTAAAVPSAAPMSSASSVSAASPRRRCRQQHQRRRQNGDQTHYAFHSQRPYLQATVACFILRAFSLNVAVDWQLAEN
jgi:hypothetical protein